MSQTAKYPDTQTHNDHNNPEKHKLYHTTVNSPSPGDANMRQ